LKGDKTYSIFQNKDSIVGLQFGSNSRVSLHEKKNLTQIIAHNFSIAN